MPRSLLQLEPFEHRNAAGNPSVGGGGVGSRAEKFRVYGYSVWGLGFIRNPLLNTRPGHGQK